MIYYQKITSLPGLKTSLDLIVFAIKHKPLTWPVSLYVIWILPPSPTSFCKTFYTHDYFLNYASSSILDMPSLAPTSEYLHCLLLCDLPWTSSHHADVSLNVSLKEALPEYLSEVSLPLPPSHHPTHTPLCSILFMALWLLRMILFGYCLFPISPRNEKQVSCPMHCSISSSKNSAWHLIVC